MAQGKFSQPRKPRRESDQPPIPQPRKPDPMDTIPQEIGAFVDKSTQDNHFTDTSPSWQDATRVMPENWKDATQVIREDWRTDTQIVPDNWRDATRVVPEYQPSASRPQAQWDFDEQPAPQPAVRNHLLDNEDSGEYADYYEDEPQGNSRKVMIIGICSVIALILFGTIFLVSSFFSKKEKDDGLILQHVTAAGVNLGGMTQEEALQALHRATDDTYTGQDMVIHLPDSVLVLSPADTGAKLDVEAVVEAAYNHGRIGSQAEISRAKSQAASGLEHTIALLPYLELNETYIREMLDTYGALFNSNYESSSYTFKGTKPVLTADRFDENAPCETLVLHVGTPGRYLDMEDLYDQVLDAYSFHTFEVSAQESTPESIPELLDLEKIYKTYCSDPIDAYMDMQTFEVIPETYGYAFDLEEAKAKLQTAEFGSTIEIPMEYVAPEILGKDLEEVLFRDTLASYETKHTSDANRNTNLKLACQAINGHILNPGDSFSFNDVVGKRTEAGGYKAANAYFGGDTVSEIGGGICQVSSTLYYCVLVADLDVTARQPHSYVPSYIPMGMDATVSWGGPEFKFRNDTNYPLRIDAEVSGGYVKVSLIGTEEKDYTVKLDYKVTKTNEPETKYEDYEFDNKEGYKDGDVIQEGVTGYEVKTYKYKYDKETGTLIGEIQEATSTYKTREAIIARVAPEETEPPTEPPTEAPTEAPTEPPVEEPTNPPTEAVQSVAEDTEASAETTVPTE